MNFWQELNLETAPDAVLTGHTGPIEDMPIYGEVTKLFEKTGNVLDFGTGVGRNLPYLLDRYDKVYAYDYKNMTDLIPVIVRNSPSLTILNSLEDVCKTSYDEVLFSLVLQHIHPEELNTILERVSLLSRRFIIHSRVWVDFTEEQIMPMLNKYFKVIQIEYQKDPNSDRDDHFIGLFEPLV